MPQNAIILVKNAVMLWREQSKSSRVGRLSGYVFAVINEKGEGKKRRKENL